MTSASLLLAGFAVLAYLGAAAGIYDCSDVPFNIMSECGRALEAKDLQPAIQFANSLMAKYPTCVDSFQCAGIVCYTLGDLHNAIRAFEEAARLNPESAVVFSNLGLARHSAGYLEGAVRAYEEAVRLAPGVMATVITLCDMYEEIGKHDQAMSIRESLLTEIVALPKEERARHAEDETELRRRLAKAYVSSGRTNEATKVLEDGIVHNPNLLLLYALSKVPYVAVSEAEIAACRDATQAAVENVIDKLQRGVVKLGQSGTRGDYYGDMGYYLTYHGLNDEVLRRRIGVMHALAYPELLHAAPHVNHPILAYDMGEHSAAAYQQASRSLMKVPPSLPRKIRVGFVSAHVHLHSVSKMIARLITGLPRLLFTVLVFGFSGPEDHITKMIKTQVDGYFVLPKGRGASTLARAVAIVEGQQLDVLVYPEIGMDLSTYYMAMHRLAPVQISTHGNSETSGLGDSIDYFASFDAIESPHGYQHYSEQLIRLEGCHSQFMYPMHLASPVNPFRHQAIDTLVNVDASGDPKDWTVSHLDVADAHIQTEKQFFGQRADEILFDRGALAASCSLVPTAVVNVSSSCAVQPLYMCPQSLYKLHPVFDSVIADILLSDACGRVVFLHGSSPAWDAIIVKRIADQLAASLGLIPFRHSLFNSSVVSEATRCSVLKALTPYLQRISIAPQRGHNAFLELLAAADVVVDSYPFGGCTSSYEALTQGTPVVSTPSDALRGRFTMALLQRLGLDHFIAPTLKELAPMAVELGNYVAGLTREERKSMQSEIAVLARSRALADDTPMHDWAQFLIRVTAAHWRTVYDNDSAQQ